eukprot:2405808-Prymnesium_polylepis.1
MNVLAWTWFLARPEDQVNMLGHVARWFVPPAVHGLYPPPWSKPVYDVRLINFDKSHIFATFNCKSCTFSIALLMLTGDVTTDGGISDLRAWCAYPSARTLELPIEAGAACGVALLKPARTHSSLSTAPPVLSRRSPKRFRAHEPWMQGRNQAVFVSTLPQPENRSLGEGALSDPRPSLLVQPWLGLVGDYGRPNFVRRQMICYPLYQPIDRWGVNMSAPDPGAKLMRLNWMLRERSMCGLSRPRSNVSLVSIGPTAGEATLQQEYEKTSAQCPRSEPFSACTRHSARRSQCARVDLERHDPGRSARPKEQHARPPPPAQPHPQR